MNTRWRVSLVLASALLLAACGFHLRRDANLPAGMAKVYLTVAGSADFKRALTRALAVSDATVVDAPGPGVAHLQIAPARFSVDALTVTGEGRISEKAVRFHVGLEVLDAAGKVLIGHQEVTMSREFTYSAGNAIGQEGQIKALEQSMIQDMVRSVMFRLEAAARQHPAAASAAPAAASSAG